jgi:hypothetical protein
LTTLIVEFGRQSPLFGIGGRGGEAATRQINLGFVALVWLPLSLPAMLATWEDAVRRDAHAEALASLGHDVELTMFAEPEDE